MNVGKRMTSTLVTVSPSLPIMDALAMMNREKIRHMPVVEKYKLVGIVTKNDLLNASPSKATTLTMWEINSLLSKITIKDVMSSPVITTLEDTPIEEAARIMVDNQISCLPVMRGNELVGIITETDLFKIFMELMGARNRGVRLTAEVQDTPGTLSRLSQAIYEAGGNIIALGTFSGETIASTLLTIKVEGIEEQNLKKALEPHVLKLTDLRML